MKENNPYNELDLGECPETRAFPPLLTALYGFRRREMAGIAVIAMEPLDGLPTLAQLMRHLRVVRSYLPDEKIVVRCHNLPLPYQRTFLSEHIPYQEIRTGSLYLPFIGLVYRGCSEPPTMTPMAQLLALHHMLTRARRLFSHGLAERFSTSAMSVSAALGVLGGFPEFVRGKQGRLLYLETALAGAELFLQFRPRLFTPVRSRAYIHLRDLPDSALPAGESALGKLTDLAPPAISVFAIAKKTAAALPLYGMPPAVDGYAQVEIWRYSPHLLAQSGMVDPYSLLLSLETGEDPRLRQAETQLIQQLS